MSTNPNPEVEVEVYRNLHRKTWSIRGRRSRLVHGHADAVTLAGAEFRVSAAGRERVLRERRKNVHAVVRGTLVENADPMAPGWKAARYNPYVQGYFTDGTTGERVDRAGLVMLTAHGQLLYRLDNETAGV